MDEYLLEFQEWRTYFNQTIAPFLFGIGLAGATAGENGLWICIAGLFFMCAYTHSSGKFPKLIAQLRKTKRNRHEERLYKSIMQDDFGIPAAFTKFLPYTLSCIFVATVMAGGWT